ncbi:MAG TPA: ATP-binding protein [Candidatus Angelobacter sp.]|nr:ATP-binding protein [Candidatus Angelobacter sp.]
MSALLYVRLIGYTAGTLLQLFWMVVILGYRRQRNLERVFFFLCLSLFLLYSGSLLSLNAQLYYGRFPAGLTSFSMTTIVAGLCFFPTLLVHLHLEFAETRGLLQSRLLKKTVLAFAYVIALYFAGRYIPSFLASGTFDFVLPVKSFPRYWFPTWVGAALGFCVYWEYRLAKNVRDEAERRFFDALWPLLFLVFAAFADAHRTASVSSLQIILGTAVSLSPILPLSVLIYYVQRHNFLQIGRQRNLVYAVCFTFLALLYLSAIRRVSVWLEPVLPPEATAAILVFVLVVFFEPLQRFTSKALRATAQSEIDRANRVMGAIREVARLGDSTKLKNFIQQWVKERLELAEVNLTLADAPTSANATQGQEQEESENKFPIRQAGRFFGILEVRPHGAMLSGETRAGLESLCEQLPGALDLCRLIEEKLRLERELAERERLALVGQMAASISHNLKNPLGSIKTILQVQLENPELPDSIRGETRMVLEEIGRLSTKLNQLLQFSRPAVRGGNGAGSCDVARVVEEVAGVLSHEAERRGLQLQTQVATTNGKVAVSAEALNDVLANLVVNALEATPRGGHVLVSAAPENGNCSLLVEDDGPGIPAALREKILQPFFTTKSQGTGLGLAIVARRVAEFGGKVEWESPVKDGHGTRFKVTMPVDR